MDVPNYEESIDRIRHGLLFSFLLVLGSFVVAAILGRAYVSLGGAVSGSVLEVLQYVGIGILLWATLAKQGWSIQTMHGATVPELLNEFLYRALYVFGSFRNIAGSYKCIQLGIPADGPRFARPAAEHGVRHKTTEAMKFELEQNNRGASDEDLLADMRRAAKALGRESITVAQYETVGQFSPGTIQKRMGSWTRALTRAGLSLNRYVGITDQDLFENIEALWLSLGRQPRYGEVKNPQSRYSAKPYETRFGSWSEALRQFVQWVNTDEQPDTKTDVDASDADLTIRTPTETLKRRTRREPSDRQRFRILVRDGFRCRSCGASPLVQVGVELHVDHKVPWSKGGETTDENLETKCSKCNLGKGAAFHV